MRETLATLKTVVESTPLVLLLLDEGQRVVIGSQEYLHLVQSNEAILPSVGESWKRIPGTLTLNVKDDERRSFAVDALALPGDGAQQMVLLRPQ